MHGRGPKTRDPAAAGGNSLCPDVCSGTWSSHASGRTDVGSRRGGQPMTAPPELVPLTYSPGALTESVGPDWRERLLAAYRWMILGRALDQRMLGLQRQGRIGFYGPATGQEAVSIGAWLALAERDWVFPGPSRADCSPSLVGIRSSPTCTICSPMTGIPARGRQMPCHPTAREVRYVSMSSVIGTQISQAVGLAYGQKIRRDSGVSLAFFGDGASSANDFHARDEPRRRVHPSGRLLPHEQPVGDLRPRGAPDPRQGARGEGPRLRVRRGPSGRHRRGRRPRGPASGARWARGGYGPSLVECVVFRMTPHSSSDDPTRYHPPDFLDRGRAEETRWPGSRGCFGRAVC